MGSEAVGQIVQVPFPFFAPEPGRFRPVLITTPADAQGDFRCLAITTQSISGNGRFLDLPADTLSISARVHLDQRFSLKAANVKKVLGKLPLGLLKQVLKAAAMQDAETYYDSIHAPEKAKAFTPGEDRIAYAGRVFDSGEVRNLIDASLDFWLTAGPYYEKFEKRLAAILGLRKSLLVNSGSSANLVAFATLTSPMLGDRRVRKGDEFITVAAGFPTTAAPGIQLGAVPVFVDVSVDDGTYNIDVSQLEAARSERTRAVMIAHTLGNPFNLGEVTAFCKKHNLFLVEDNCDALGSKYNGVYTGTFGNMGTSSFYPPHHITMGEGGAVYTNDLKIARAAESIRDWGRDCWCASGLDNTCGKRFDWDLGALPPGYDHKYVYSHFGYNLKATDLQAAVGLAQLEKIDLFAAARKRNWQILRDGLAGLEECFVLPAPTAGSDPSWFGFVLTVRDGMPFTRNEITRYLESRKIQTRLLFAGNLLRQPVFDDMRKSGEGYRVIGDLKETDRVMNHTFWVGVYPGMKPGMVEYMAAEISNFTKNCKNLRV